MNLKKLFFILFLLNSITSVFVISIITKYQNATMKLEDAYNMRYKSLILADELRQSSDDLTRMARTYVLTGDRMFEEQYKTVLDIRNGLKARPLNYNDIFWDFYTIKNNKPSFDGDKIPLRELMQQANFPEEELGLLFTSQNESDDLTYLETKAMNAVKGIFQDSNGSYTIHKNPDFKFARDLMHSDEYHQAKIRIMNPLNKFYKAFEKRTNQKVVESHQIVKNLEWLVNVTVLFSIFLFFTSFGIILLRVIFPLDGLRKTMSKLSRNDMEVTIQKKVSNDEVGDMTDAVVIFKDNMEKLISSEHQLTLAIKTANYANKAKSIFLARMSHELRTPLNAILGFSSLLSKSSSINTNEKENIKIIRKSAEHLLNIINEILELSKIEAGKIEIIPQSVNLREIIKEIHSLFEFRCESKGLQFNLLIDQNVPVMIEIDEKRLKQILINLLNNAVKFTNNGKIELAISSRKNKIIFEINDTGIGIKRADLKRIFKPFEQIQQKKEYEHGTGLGLSISKELITLMGGGITVKSEEGVGSRFVFHILYKESQMIDKPYEVSKNIVGLQPLSQVKTILIVDDISENRILLSEILKQYGFSIIEASSGEEALEKIDKHSIDLIFMDILMGGINGLQTTKIIRNKKSKNSKIPIIAISANVFDEDKQQALDCGMDDFLPKPFEEKEILLILNKYLQLELLYTTGCETVIQHNETSQISIDDLNAIKQYAMKMDSENIEKILKEKIEDEEVIKYLSQMMYEFRYLEIVKFCDNFFIK